MQLQQVHVQLHDDQQTYSALQYYIINITQNRINGVPACANKELLTDILRNEWGFKGLPHTINL